MFAYLKRRTSITGSVRNDMIGMLIGEGLVFALVAGLLTLYAWMFGRIAGRLGRNPVLFGCLFLIPFVQLIPMAVLAFGEQRATVAAE